MLLLHFCLISLCISVRKGPMQTPVAYPLSISTKLMNITGYTICDSLGSTCPQDNFEKPSSYSCGQICWSDNGNATFSYTFKGIQFLVYGRHNKDGKFNLYVDNKNLGEIIERKNEEKVADLLYISDVYDYGDHTIQAIGQPDQYFEIYKFAFWPEKNVKRLNISDMDTTGKWIKESDEIGGIHEYCKDAFGARKSFKIEASKLWIYGTSAPQYSKLKIKYNKINQIVETDSNLQECKLLFESEKMNYTLDTLDLVAIENKSMLIYCVYYLYDPPVKLKSDIIHQASDLEFKDKKITKELPENKQIYIKSNSKITQISGCTFTNIEMKNYLINNIKFNFILIILILIGIFILFRNIAKNNIDNTFVFVVLGDTALNTKDSSNESITLKCTNYCLSSYALLIKRLAIKHLRLNENHICILGKGDEKDFDISKLLPNDKVLIQLTIDEIYTTNFSISELNLKSFQSIITLISAIQSFIRPFKCKNPNIILFLYDNCDESKFWELNYLNLYLRLSNIPHSSLQIYNDICKSNSMLITIKNYFTISEIINSFWRKITLNELFFLQSVAKKLYPKGNSDQWNMMISLDSKYYNYFTKIDKSESFEIISSLEEEYLLFREKILNDDFYSYFSNEELDFLVKIINCYKSEYSLYPQNYKTIHNIFEKGVKVVKKILSNLNISNVEFINIIESLRSNKYNYNCIKFKTHKNHSIIVSSDKNSVSPTFGTIRVNEHLKIVAGSPAMGAFIIEALMNGSLGKTSINNIKKLVNGNYKGFIKEYAVKSGRKGRKKWIRSFINYWESYSFSKKGMFLNQKENNTKINIEDIMKSVDFHLCDSCHIEFKDNYCITEKMQPIIKKENCKKINFIGLRLSDQNQKYDDSDDDDDRNNIQTKTFESQNSSIISSSSSFDDFFENADYDMVIPSEYVDKISQNIPTLSSVYFPLRICEVFKYELKNIRKSPKFNNKYPLKNNETELKAPEDFKCMIRDWIKYFFPSHTIIYEIDDLMNLFYTFTENYEISEDDYKIIFYKIMNIADQVASQLSPAYKKTAYYTNRFKNNTHDAELTQADIIKQLAMPSRNFTKEDK